MSDAPPLGSNVLVVGSEPTAALRYAFDRFDETDGPTVVVNAASRTESVLAAAGEAWAAEADHVVDCSSETADATALDAAVTVAGSDVPSVGEATVQALDDATAPVGLCLDSVSAMVERSSTQQAYKLLYLVTERVRSLDARAFYTWSGPIEERTRRILARPLDDVVRLGVGKRRATGASDGEW